MTGAYYKTTEETDLYPYRGNDSLSNYSTPAATLHHKNLSGRSMLNVAIKGIARDNDGLMSLEFKDFSTKVHKPEPGELFYESFDDCNGIGGNDSIFSGGSTGIGSFMPDNDGWEGLAMTGANRCVKSGTNTKSGQMTTPEFHIDSIAAFSFMAAPFGNDGLTLSLSANGTASISPNTFTLTKGQWTRCEATITGSGTITVNIMPQKRMFLDEVKAIAPVTAMRGDANGDRIVNIADINVVIDMILAGNYSDRGDVNNDGDVNIVDINAIIDMILKQ
jgi:hypothetical protein